MSMTIQTTGICSDTDLPKGEEVTGCVGGVVMVTNTFTPPTTGLPQLEELLLVAAALQ